MKKWLSVLICTLLVLAVAVPAFAAAPAANSLNARQMLVRRNTSFTPESYPEIWITPVYGEYIIAQTDPEKYPARFLRFAPPENTAPVSLNSDSAAFLNHDELVMYNYFAYDRASFELFLEKAEADFTLSDGTGGVAAYIQPDSYRARAMVDLKPQFGGTAKLEIIINAHSGDVTNDQLTEMIQAEIERIQTTMQLEELTQYWSEGVFESVELSSDSDPVKATVDTQGLTVSEIETSKLTSQVVEGRYTSKTVFSIEAYAYPHQKEDSIDAALQDGTPYRQYCGEFISYASFLLLEDGKYGPVYLNITIDCVPEAFAQLLEQAYARVAIEK